MEKLKLKKPQKLLSWKLTDYIAVITPFNMMARIFGLCAHNMFNRKKKIDLVARGTRYVMLIIWIIFFVYFGRANYQVNYFATLSNNEIANTGRRMMLFFGMSISVIGISSTYLVKRSVYNFLYGILRFDYGLERIGHSVNLKIEAIAIIAYIVSLTTFSSVIVFIAAKYYDITDNYTEFIHMYVPMYITNTIYMVFSSRFIVYCMSITHRFRILNKSFERFLNVKHEYEYNLKKSRNVRLNHNSALDYAKLHGILTDAVNDVTNTYGIQLMVMFGGIFCYIITTVFTLFRTIFYNDDRLVSLTGSFTVWGVFYIVPLIMVISVGSCVKNDGKYTSVLIHRGINESRNIEFRNELVCFSQQLNYNYPVVTCGLFIFDWSLMFSIISAITTYLMILVQFDSKMNK